jgi:hypothetical protein
MHTSLESLCASLDALAAAIIAGKPDDNTYLATWGWNCPPLNSAQIADGPLQISSSIRSAGVKTLDAQQVEKVTRCQASISAFQSNSLPYLFNGNATASYPNFVALISHTKLLIDPIINFPMIQSKQVMAATRKLESLTAVLDKAIVDEKAFSAKIALIDEAATSADELPITLKQLQDAHAQIEKSVSTASEFIGKIDTLHQESISSLSFIREKSIEAEELAKQCSEAYRATTSTGLAFAFDDRARKLARSVNYWVVGLFLALAAGAVVGYYRFEKMSSLMGGAINNPSVIWIELILSALSLGLPLWFAWISTTQIGERFRLSEDYAFKASVAAAYEGYRREAAKFNTEAQQRLFEAALSRFEEQPLRFVKTHASSSPLHETGVIESMKNGASEISNAVVTTAKTALGVGKEKES